MTSLAKASLSGYCVGKRRLMLRAIPAPSWKSVEIQCAMESVDCSTSPWISEYWKCLGSGGLSFVRLGHSWSSSGASAAESSVAIALSALSGVQERPSEWPIDFPGLCTTS